MSPLKWDGVDLEVRTFAHDDLRMLGETLQLSAEILHIKRISRAAIYECKGTRILVVSGAFKGKPFAVQGFEVNGDEIDPATLLPIYTVEHTGDGLTFMFDWMHASKVGGNTRTVCAALQDQAHKARTL